eukprot:5217852-Pleurochrysis_carterae.AAC.1
MEAQAAASHREAIVAVARPAYQQRMVYGKRLSQYKPCAPCAWEDVARFYSLVRLPRMLKRSAVGLEKGDFLYMSRPLTKYI